MKILHVNSLLSGGAAIAALRLHEALLNEGMDSHFLSSGEAPNIRNLRSLSRLSQFLGGQVYGRINYRLDQWLTRSKIPPLSAGMLPGFALREIERFAPDVVHLHWIKNGMLSIEQIGKINRPVVWTLHDMAPLSSGFDYRLGSPVPQGELASLEPLFPFSAFGKRVLERKNRIWKEARLKVVAPSEWMKAEAQASPAFQGKEVFHIPYTLSLKRFYPQDQTASRIRLGLPLDIPLVLFGAEKIADRRKGMDLLLAALEKMQNIWPKSHPLPGLVTFGSQGNADLRKSLRLPLFPLGRVSDEDQLASIYSACDVFACPSREDNLPNTVLEAIASNIPCVAFRVGGLPDMIIPDISGKLAEPFDTTEMAEQIAELLTRTSVEESEKWVARTFAETTFSSRRVVTAYKAVYQSFFSNV